MKKTKDKKNPHPAEVLSPGRRTLFRPARSKYVRKELKQSACVFCDAGSHPDSADSLCVFQSKLSMIIVNKFPYNSGHLLVLPRRHCGDFLELDGKEFRDLHETLRVATKAMKDVYAPAGMNMGMNHGAAAGAGIPQHLHYHLIPRWVGDLNFFPLLTQTKVVIETAEESYQRYREYFSKARGRS